MQYIDPLPVTCRGCAKKGSYRVADLLALTATCRFCSQSLEYVGLEMRSAFAENAAFFGTVEIALEVERELGVGISDSVL